MPKVSYEQKMNFIAPYVDFSFKHPQRLGRKNKVKLTRYFNFLSEKLEDYQAVSPPRGVSFERVQEDLNPTFKTVKKKIKRTEFRKIFLPKTIQGEIKYDKKAKKWSIIQGAKGGPKIRETIIRFTDKDALVSDPKAYVESLIRRYSDTTFFRLFNPQDWRSPGRFDRSSIGGYITFLSNKYPEDFGRFMQGLIVEERIK